VTKVTFIFETSLNTKPEEKKVWETWSTISLLFEKVGGHISLPPTKLRPWLLL